MPARLAWAAPLLALSALLPLAGRPTHAAAPLVGDVNGDCAVNILDLSLVARRYLVARGSLLYAPVYDLNGDGVINILDLQIVAARMGTRC